MIATHCNDRGHLLNAFVGEGPFSWLAVASCQCRHNAYCYTDAVAADLENEIGQSRLRTRKQERHREATQREKSNISHILICTVIHIHAIDSIWILESVYVIVRVEVGQTFGESGSEGEGIHLDW